MKGFQIIISAFFTAISALAIISFTWCIFIDQNTDLNIDPYAWDLSFDYFMFGGIAFLMIASLIIWLNKFVSLIKNRSLQNP